jgi:hypothetical protein
MKSIRILAAIVVVVVTTTVAQTQTHQELFLFSQNNLTGNARFVAMGGAFGALGANFGVASTNPAGLGFYTRHEISISAAVGTWNSETRYDNKSKSAFDVSFQMPEIHYVYSTPNAKFQFGLGINRLNDFNARTVVEGNSNNSFTNAIVTNAKGIPPASLGGLEKFAYDAYLVNPLDTIRHTYFSILDAVSVSQRQVTETSGNLTEIALSFSGNVSEKLYFGATLGIPVLNYSEQSTLKETAISTPPVVSRMGFSNYSYEHKYNVDGTGINLKLGLIYKPINAVRIGIAFHTPTYYSIRQKFERKLQSYMSIPDKTTTWYDDYGWDGTGHFYGFETKNFKYGYFTPAKGILSLGFVIGTYGVVGIEGELQSYRSIKMISDNELADYVNEDIKNKYEKISGTVKIGTEWRVSVVSLRAGYNYRSNPYIDKENNLWSNHLVTGGLGVRFNKNLSLDLGVMYVFNPETYYPYYLDNAKTSILPDKVSTSKMLYTLTFNARF